MGKGASVIPDNRLSTHSHAGNYLPPDADKRTPPTLQKHLYDLALGGVALNDTSKGLSYQTWTFGYTGGAIWAQPALTGERVVVLVPGAGVTSLSGCFDANMYPVLAYTQNGISKLYWYDNVVPDYVVTNLTGCESPRVTLDDKRPTMQALNDVLVFYIKAGALYYRQQRDRYGVERHLCECPESTLRIERVSMNVNNCLQIEFIISV